MSVEDIFRLGDRTIAQSEKIFRLEIENKYLRANNAALLAVLEDMVELVGWQVKRNDPAWDGSVTPTSILGRARAAIAAAKGEENGAR
jgi:hypothetical protein